MAPSLPPDFLERALEEDSELGARTRGGLDLLWIQGGWQGL